MTQRAFDHLCDRFVIWNIYVLYLEICVFCSGQASMSHATASRFGVSVYFNLKLAFWIFDIYVSRALHGNFLRWNICLFQFEINIADI